ncbi:MAG: DMT family transporter [bacterium]|nr:DMT family transporter [bacterium]
MSFFIPLLSAIFQAGSLTLDKIILSFRRMGWREYVGVSFPLSFLVVFALFLIVRPPLTLALFSGGLVWLLVASILLAAGSNLFFYYALDRDRLAELGIAGLLNRIPIILFSSIFFADERRFGILIPALIASTAIIWSHWERHHLKMARGTIIFILWSFLAGPLLAMTSKSILIVMHPISYDLIRTGTLAVIFGLAFFRHARSIPRAAVPLLLATNTLTSLSNILFFFSYQLSGIVYTSLLFSFEPLLVHFSAVFFLKERLHWKKSIAFAVVLLSILAAQFYGAR